MIVSVVFEETKMTSEISIMSIHNTNMQRIFKIMLLIQTENSLVLFTV